jgi:hypothetical protein
MEQLDCPVSQQKTLENSTIGEFAGFVITKNRIYRPEKVVYPTRGNLMYRLGKTIHPSSARDVRTLISTLLIGFVNRDDIPLQDRIKIKHIFRDLYPNDYARFLVLGKHLRYRIINEICGPVADHLSNVFQSREEVERNLSQCMENYEMVHHSLRNLQSSSDDEEYPLYTRLFNLFKFGYGLVPNPIPKIFKDKGVTLRDCQTLEDTCDVIRNGNMHSKLERRILSCFYRGQLRICKKSKAIVEYELLSMWLDVLDEN